MSGLDWRSAAVRQMLTSKGRGRCGYCGVEIRALSAQEARQSPHLQMSVDHIMPRSRGGCDEEDNLRACCKSCNQRKGSSSLEAFRLNMQRAESGRPNFTREQLVWLHKQGFEFPAEPRYVFHFELFEMEDRLFAEIEAAE